MKVAVLGCGPSGLLAAHAATLAGHKVAIYAAKVRKSRLYGAQYLHESIPGLRNSEPIEVKYNLIGGTEADYRKKVYGNSWDGEVSPDTLEKDHLAWDIRDAYDQLWKSFELNIMQLDFDMSGPENRQVLEQIVAYQGIDRVISSIPRTVWDNDPSKFASSKIWAMGDAPDLGQHAPVRVEPGTVLCDASKDTGWYRASNIFNHTTVEWPYNQKPPVQGVAEVIKPLDHSSTVLPWVCHVGRYGEWKKGVLTTDAFTKAFRAVGQG